MQSRIQRYIEYVIFEEETGKRQLDLLNQKLSNKLKEELTLDIYRSVIKSYPLLYRNFSPDMLKKVALKIKEVDFAPDDLVFEVNNHFIKSNEKRIGYYCYFFYIF